MKQTKANRRDFIRGAAAIGAFNLVPARVLWGATAPSNQLARAIIGCGAIGPFWGKEDESSLFTIFVLPEHQGKGVGSLIINTLEKDEFFQRAKRVEIPASITGVPFYLKMGYNYKDGITDPDEEHLIRLEKIR